MVTVIVKRHAISWQYGQFEWLHMVTYFQIFSVLHPPRQALVEEKQPEAAKLVQQMQSDREIQEDRLDPSLKGFEMCRVV